jgi:predicted PurR-regulated permease PerM
MAGPASGPRLRRVGGWPVAAALAVLAVVLYIVRYALLPFVLAAAVAFVTDPLIAAGQRLTGFRRWSIAAGLCAVLFAGLAAAAWLVAATVARDLLHVLAHAPDIVRYLVTQAVGEHGITIFGRHYAATELVDALFAATARLLGVDAAARLATKAAAIVFVSVLTLVLLPYFMISGPRLMAATIWLVPPERRHAVLVVLSRLVPALRRYLIGVALVVM